MIRILTSKEKESEKSIFWIDVIDPSTQELEELALKYQLHKTSLIDCLDPLHLPKYEEVIDTHFMILRHADPLMEKSSTADTVCELTRKIAFFVLPQGLITVHRSQQKFIDLIFDKWQSYPSTELQQTSKLINQLMKAVILSYQPALEWVDQEFLKLETQVLTHIRQSELLKQLYFLKGRVSVYKKMLLSSLNAISQIDITHLKTSPYFQDLKEEGERQYFRADEMLEDMNSLLQTQLAIASHKTNEVIRVLTLFSVFFLPLTFIVGVYGMNFEYMPELHWKLGYPAILALMLMVTTIILLWFNHKGWWSHSENH